MTCRLMSRTNTTGKDYVMNDYFRTKPPLITCSVLKAIQTAAKDREGKSSGPVQCLLLVLPTLLKYNTNDRFKSLTEN